MNMIPFHHIDKPNYFVVQFKSYQNILMIENYCSDPDCHCHEVLLNFAQLNDQHKISNYLLNLRVDINTGKIIEKTILEESIDADSIIYEFHQHFNQFKNHLIENQQKVKNHFAKFQDQQLSVEVLNLINGGNCVDYTKVFGYTNQVTINFENENYLIEDQYCMKPSCSCNEVIMVVFKPNAIESDFVFRLDLNTNHHEILKFNSNKDHIGLINEIIDTKKSILKARYDRMKQVGEKFLATKPVEKPKLVLKKVGRNELCPCGSGKKYKKCCG